MRLNGWQRLRLLVAASGRYALSADGSRNHFLFVPSPNVLEQKLQDHLSSVEEKYGVLNY